MLPWLRVMPLPERMTKGSWERAAKAKSSPTAVRTDGSITPVGGTINPETIKPIDTTRHTAKATVCHRITLNRNRRFISIVF